MDVLIFISASVFMAGVFFYAYRQGVRDGMRMRQGLPPADLNPILAREQRREAQAAKEQEEKIAEGWDNIFSYTGDPQPGWKEGETE